MRMVYDEIDPGKADNCAETCHTMHTVSSFRKYTLLFCKLIVPLKRHLDLRERAAGYQGEYQPMEGNTEKPVGKEVW